MGSEGLIAVAAALPAEFAGIKRRGRFRKTAKEGFEYLEGELHGTGLALFASGVGDAMAYETAKDACAALPLIAYLSIGMSGALSPSLRAGDVVVGVRTSTPSGREYSSDRELAKLAMRELSAGDGVGFGTLLAADKVVVASAEKKDIAARTSCIAVDMESAGAARAATEAGVPFIAVRAISDALEDDLPVDFNRFTRDGELDYAGLLLHVVTHPSTIPPLIRLGRNSRTASENIASAVERLCSAISTARA